VTIDLDALPAESPAFLRERHLGTFTVGVDRVLGRG
jgi:hypothetical protein